MYSSRLFSESRRFSLYFSLVLFALILIVYGQTLFSSFHFDDRSSIIDNRSFRSARPIPAIWQEWPTRFITNLSFYLNYRIDRLNPFGYHLVNLLIHGLNAMLVYFLLRQAFRSRSGEEPLFGSAAAALVFALHPLQTQAVSYIAQRATLLAALFFLLSLLLYVRGNIKKKPLYFPAAWVIGAAAMFSKEMAMTLPAAIFLWEYCFGTKGGGKRKIRLGFFALLFLIIPLTVITNSDNPHYRDSGQIEFAFKNTADIRPMGGVIPPGQREYALTQIRVMTTYLRLVFLPLGQNLDYHYPIFNSLFSGQIILSALMLISILTAGVLLKKNGSGAGAFGIFFFFLVLLPESSLIPIRDVIFEHRLYLPLAGAVVIFGAGLKAFTPKKWIVLFLVVLLAILTGTRNRIWKDEITLWRDTAAKSSGKGRPLNNLGFVFNREKKYTEAVRVLEKALDTVPDYPEAMINLAVSYKNLNDLEKAEELCRRAILLQPDYPRGHNTRGDILRLRGETEEAAGAYRRALELDPFLLEARNNLANLLEETGRPELAARQYERARRMGGESAEYLNNLGLHYLNRGEIERAVTTLRRSIELDPKLAPGYYNLGNALAGGGDSDGAVENYRKAVEIDPGYSRAFFNLGVIYSQTGQWKKSLDSFLAVIGIDPDSAPAHLKAGLIYYLHFNNTPAARRHLGKALEIDPEISGAKEIRGLLERLSQKTEQ